MEGRLGSDPPITVQIRLPGSSDSDGRTRPFLPVPEIVVVESKVGSGLQLRKVMTGPVVGLMCPKESVKVRGKKDGGRGRR